MFAIGKSNTIDEKIDKKAGEVPNNDGNVELSKASMSPQNVSTDKSLQEENPPKEQSTQLMNNLQVITKIFDISLEDILPRYQIVRDGINRVLKEFEKGSIEDFKQFAESLKENRDDIIDTLSINSTLKKYFVDGEDAKKHIQEKVNLLNELENYINNQEEKIKSFGIRSLIQQSVTDTNSGKVIFEIEQSLRALTMPQDDYLALLPEKTQESIKNFIEESKSVLEEIQGRYPNRTPRYFEAIGKNMYDKWGDGEVIVSTHELKSYKYLKRERTHVDQMNLYYDEYASCANLVANEIVFLATKVNSLEELKEVNDKLEILMSSDMFPSNIFSSQEGHFIEVSNSPLDYCATIKSDVDGEPFIRIKNVNSKYTNCYVEIRKKGNLVFMDVEEAEPVSFGDNSREPIFQNYKVKYNCDTSEIEFVGDRVANKEQKPDSYTKQLENCVSYVRGVLKGLTAIANNLEQEAKNS